MLLSINTMEPTASQHLLVVVPSLLILLLYMCRLDLVIFARPRRRSAFSRPQPTFGNREWGGETMLVDPDGRVTRVSGGAALGGR